MNAIRNRREDVADVNTFWF